MRIPTRSPGAIPCASNVRATRLLNPSSSAYDMTCLPTATAGRGGARSTLSLSRWCRRYPIIPAFLFLTGSDERPGAGPGLKAEHAGQDGPLDLGGTGVD